MTLVLLLSPVPLLTAIQITFSPQLHPMNRHEGNNVPLPDYSDFLKFSATFALGEFRLKLPKRASIEFLRDPFDFGSVGLGLENAEASTDSLLEDL